MTMLSWTHWWCEESEEYRRKQILVGKQLLSPSDQKRQVQKAASFPRLCWGGVP